MIHRTISLVRSAAGAVVASSRALGKPKFFCVGLNKTGTTSLAAAFVELGFSLGNQRRGEIIGARFQGLPLKAALISHAMTAEVFQDIPFSWPKQYEDLARAFPNAKFILTERDDPEQWYSSLVRFHSKKFGRDGSIPTTNDLQNAMYVQRGFAYRAMRELGASDEAPYDKGSLIRTYLDHSLAVRRYFDEEPARLLTINVGNRADWARFLAFVGKRSDRDQFPWENRT